ncbi:hypothetical protein KUTeg_022762 [Tegillarca granosa]|uniref:SH3 domain-containing protein n=1 Tax=Tegillarca granosa TaxID=220873 RepID=A0ABQ9E0C8_TEGGR|nr:hypothetical protein KUTeg_022762 [Tegillarca granosa]
MKPQRRKAVPSQILALEKSLKKQQNNPYVVLYNFRGKEKDDLDLRAGWRVTVTDSSDQDWWKIVLQAGDETDGMIHVMAANNKQAVCPLKYLNECI